MMLETSSESGHRFPAAQPQWTRTFVWLGRSLLGMMLIVIVGSLGLLATVKALNRSAAAYVDNAVHAIADPWNAQAFMQRAVPGVLPPNAQEVVPKAFERFATLGKFESAKAATGRVGHGAYPGTPIRGFWAEYRVDAKFERGPAQLRLVMQREDGGWSIAAFEIASPVFAQQKE